MGAIPFAIVYVLLSPVYFTAADFVVSLMTIKRSDLRNEQNLVPNFFSSEPSFLFHFLPLQVTYPHTPPLYRNPFDQNATLFSTSRCT